MYWQFLEFCYYLEKGQPTNQPHSQRNSVMAKGESELWPLNKRTLEKFDQCHNTNSQNTNNWPRSCALYKEREIGMREKKKAKVTTTLFDSCRKIGCSSVPTRMGSSCRSAFGPMIHLTQSSRISANAHTVFLEAHHKHTACIAKWQKGIKTKQNSKTAIKRRSR